MLNGKYSSYFNSFGSEMYREAYCRFIVCLCEAQLPLSKETVGILWELVGSTLERKEEALQSSAVEAYRALAAHHGFIDDRQLARFIERIHPSKDAVSRRGYALALGRTPIHRLDASNYSSICRALMQAAALQTDQKQWNDAEARRNAVQGMTTLITATNQQFEQLNTPGLFGDCIKALVGGLADYAVDSRGDVGSWVREACMCGLKALVSLALSTSDTGAYLSADVQKVIFSKVLQQSAEKIDKIRACAGDVLMHLLYECPGFHVAHRERFIAALPK
jgi:hypothetical protein